MNTYSNMFLLFYLLWVSFYHRDIDNFYGLILVEKHRFELTITPTQCIGHHQIAAIWLQLQ